MRSEVFELIKNTITEKVKWVKEVNLWNEQLTDIDSEVPFKLPAVFVEFLPVEWDYQLKGRRETVMTINLHIIFNPKVGSYEEALDCLRQSEEICNALHGVNKSAQNYQINSFRNVSSAGGNNFDELLELVDTYTTHITDFTLA